MGSVSLIRFVIFCIRNDFCRPGQTKIRRPKRFVGLKTKEAKLHCLLTKVFVVESSYCLLESCTYEVI